MTLKIRYSVRGKTLEDGTVVLHITPKNRATKILMQEAAVMHEMGSARKLLVETVQHQLEIDLLDAAQELGTEVEVL